MNSQQLSAFYYAAGNAHDVHFWNSADSIDAHRNIASILRQYPMAMIRQNDPLEGGGTPAGDMADYLERRAQRLERENAS